MGKTKSKWALTALAATLVLPSTTASVAETIESSGDFSWTGIYAGMSVGASRMTVVDTDTDRGVGIPWFETGATLETGGNAWIYGLSVGADYDLGNWVLGIVGDINGSSFDQTTETFGVMGSTDLRWMTTLRARAGWEFSEAPLPVLAYATGGLAVAQIDTAISDTETTVTAGLLGPNTDTKHVTGYSVGVGLETILPNSIGLGLEYLYTDLGTYDIVGTCVTCFGGSSPGDPFVFNEDLDFHTFRATVSWRFGG